MAIIGRLNRSSMTAMVDPETSLKEHSFFAPAFPSIHAPPPPNKTKGTPLHTEESDGNAVIHIPLIIMGLHGFTLALASPPAMLINFSW
jgi:hypothetical protein